MTISLSEISKTQPNITLAVNTACEALADGDTLVLENTSYHIYGGGIFTKYYCISNNDKGGKPILFPLMGKKNITIDGGGARIILHDGMIPFVIDGCENVTVKNLSIDCTRLQFSQAEIVEADREHTILKFDGEEFFAKAEDNKLCFFGIEPDSSSSHEKALCLEFDKETRAPSAVHPSYFFYTGAPKDHGFLRHMFRDVTVHELGENLIEMRGDLGFVHTVGNMWICTYGSRNYPGFFANESSNILLQNIKLHHAPAMGVIAQLCENITLDNVIADIAENSKRMLSVKADATHFVNCRGKIMISDCKFVNMMDDAVNIHGIYLKDPIKQGGNCIVSTYGHHQQVGINIFRPGDTAAIVSADTVEVLAKFTVEKSELRDENTLIVTSKEPIPDFSGECVLENITTNPDVHIVNTESGNNRPRGFLLSSAGNILVEKCKFRNMYFALSIGGEMHNWYESTALCGDVTIRDNDFSGCAYAGRCAIAAIPHVKDPKTATKYHKNIRIENNLFKMHEKRILHAVNVENLTFTGNKFIFDDTLAPHEMLGDDGFKIENCHNVNIEPV